MLCEKNIKHTVMVCQVIMEGWKQIVATVMEDNAHVAKPAKQIIIIWT